MLQWISHKKQHSIDPRCKTWNKGGGRAVAQLVECWVCHIADAGQIPWCDRGLLSQSQLSLQTLCGVTRDCCPRVSFHCRPSVVWQGIVPQSAFTADPLWCDKGLLSQSAFTADPLWCDKGLLSQSAFTADHLWCDKGFSPTFSFHCRPSVVWQGIFSHIQLSLQTICGVTRDFLPHSAFTADHLWCAKGFSPTFSFHCRPSVVWQGIFSPPATPSPCTHQLSLQTLYVVTRDSPPPTHPSTFTADLLWCGKGFSLLLQTFCVVARIYFPSPTQLSL